MSVIELATKRRDRAVEPVQISLVTESLGPREERAGEYIISTAIQVQDGRPHGPAMLSCTRTVEYCGAVQYSTVPVENRLMELLVLGPWS